MQRNNPGEATSEEALLLLLWGIRHQMKQIDRLLRCLIEELSDDTPETVPGKPPKDLDDDNP